MSALLQDKLAAVRGKNTGVALGHGLARLIVVFLTSLAVAALFDWLIGFPLWFRAIVLVAMAAGLGWILVHQLIRPIVFGPDDEQIALWVERERPEFATRLIASVQLGQPDVIPAGVSKSLVQAMVSQTEEMAGPVDFGSVIKVDRFLKWALGAVLAIVVGGAVYLWGGSVTQALVARVFLSRVVLPTKTQVEIVTGDQKVPLGDSLKIVALAHGIRPSAGTLYVHYLSGRNQQFPMPREEGQATYAFTLDSVQESFTYSVKIFDGRTDDYRIDAFPRPSVTSVECAQVHPDYTGLGVTPRSTSDLSLLLGSRLRIRALANRPVRLLPSSDGKRNYVMRFTDEKTEKSAQLPLTVNPKDRRELTAEIALPAGTLGFSINLVDDDGITSKDSAVYRIDLLPDKPPTIRITNPDRKEILATSQSTIDVGFLAEDDYLLGKATLKFKVDEGDVQSIALRIPEKQRVVRGFYPWDIAQLAIPSGKVSLEGSVLEFWVEVEDTNDLTGPGRTASEHYLARIVTREEKKAELLARLGESLGVIRDVSESQEKASSELGMLILGTPATQPGVPR